MKKTNSPLSRFLNSVMQVSYKKKKKEKLGTTCSYNTYISQTMKPKQDLAGYFTKKWKDTNKKGAADEENNNPLPRFLNFENSERQEIKKKRNTKGQPKLNIVNYPKLKITAGTTQSKRVLYSLKWKTNVQKKKQNRYKRLKGSKGGENQDLPAGLVEMVHCNNCRSPAMIYCNN